MDCFNFPLLEHVTGEEGGNEEHDHNEERPGREDLHLARIGDSCAAISLGFFCTLLPYFIPSSPSSSSALSIRKPLAIDHNPIA
jgi:hypothetical protein